MNDDMRRMLEAIRFFNLVREESKRTIFCEPHRLDQVRAVIDQAGAADILTVRSSRSCPEGKLLVIDEGALEAQEREWQQGFLKQWRL
ncbi:hypothetical protein [Streptomyces longwoodensis]|uniref:hypothetical protein n=1 Tax=Streptomyces longwoodensis TaxID=68231 RepID=UPI002256FF96|nr:hypothetical protein [Streptomyces longwoodensis]MCX4993824.1 hypothetical protein [Streptomyces longwoodensis]MCX4998056.1 hypothetical protein [Streptomyces longwoodensis]